MSQLANTKIRDLVLKTMNSLPGVPMNHQFLAKDVVVSVLINLFLHCQRGTTGWLFNWSSFWFLFCEVQDRYRTRQREICIPL